jgi:membrane protease YdiL (CAAX protease family)
MSRICRACGAAAGRAARYCPACGASLELAAEARRTAELAEARRVARAVAIVFLGSIVALAVLPFVPAPVGGRFVTAPLLAGVGGLAALSLGPGAVRAALGRRPRALDLALGVLGGALAFAVSMGFVRFLARWIAFSGSPDEVDPLLRALELAILAPLAEEWLCRGVLWTALRRVLGTRATIVVTAALFAFLHGLNGLGELEFPHRFVLGLIAGALRARGDSLAPCVLAHATANALFLVMR